MSRQVEVGSRKRATGTVRGRESVKERRPHRFHDEARCRAAIVEAALAEFAERGYVGARMPAIQRRARVGSWLLYHHFPDKPTLHAAVVRHVHDVIRSLEVPPVGPNPMDGMAAVVRAVRALLLDRPGYLALLTAPDPLEERHVACLAGERTGGWPLLARIGETMRAGVETGAFRPDADPLRTHLAILALTVSHLSHAGMPSALHGREPGTEHEIDGWIDRTARMVTASSAVDGIRMGSGAPASSQHARG